MLRHEPEAPVPWLLSESSIYFFAVANPDYFNCQNVGLNIVNNSIIPDSESISVLTSSQLSASVREWIFGKISYKF